MKNTKLPFLKVNSIVSNGGVNRIEPNNESSKRPHRDDYRFSIFPNLVNKPKNNINGDRKKLRSDAYTNLRSTSGSFDDLFSYVVKCGNAFSPFQFKNNKRTQSNAELASFLTLDIDNGLTIQDALKNPFIAKYGFIYTTPSHTDEHHKFRIIFALPCDVDFETYKVLVNAINDSLGGVNDSCTNESARLFYGNNRAKTYNLDNFSPLPYHFITEAMKVAKEEKEKQEKIKSERRKNQKEVIATGDTKGLFDYAISLIPELPPRQKGSNQYQYLLGIVWGYCALFTQSGRSLDELKDLLESSPIASDRSQGWNVSKIIDDYDSEREGIDGKTITHLSIFHNLNEVFGTDQYTENASQYLGLTTNINPEYSKVILSGEEAIAKAKEQVENLTDAEIAEFFQDHTKKPKKDFNLQQFLQWIAEKRKSYYRSQNKRIKPDIMENSRYCNYSVIKDKLSPDYSGILNLIAPKGTGKSTVIGKYDHDDEVNYTFPDGDSLLNDYHNKGYNIISLSLRIALSEEQSHRWNLKFINSDNKKDKYKFATEYVDIALVIDSLMYLANREIDDKLVLVIDEVKSFIEHLLTSKTLKENRHLILAQFQKLIKLIYEKKGLIILSDADLRQSHLDYFQNISKKVNNDIFPSFTYTNTFKHHGRKVYSFEIENELKTITHNLIKKDKRLIIPCDSINQVQAMQQELSKDFPDKNIFGINSESIADDEISRSFVTNPNESVETLKPDVLLYTNSMGIGVSIDVMKAFDYVVCFAGGTLTPDGVRQALWRYRELVGILIYCPQKSHRFNQETPLNIGECHKRIEKLSKGSIHVSRILKETYEYDTDFDYYSKIMSLFDEDKCISDPHIKQIARIYALQNYEFQNYRECILSDLKDLENNQLITDQKEVRETFKLDKIDNDFAKDCRLRQAENKKNHAIKTAESQDIPFDEAKNLSNRSHLVPERRLEVKKAFLKHRFGDLADDPEFCFFASRDNGKNINRIAFEFYCQNQKISKFYDRKGWQDFDYKLSYGTPLLTDVKKYSHTAKLIRNLRIFEFLEQYHKLLENLDPNNPNHPTVDNLITPLRKRFLRYKKRIKEVFNLTFSKHTHTAKFLGYLLKRFGYDLHINKLTNIISISNLSSLSLEKEFNLFDKFRYPIHQALLTKFDMDYAATQKYSTYKNPLGECNIQPKYYKSKNQKTGGSNLDIFDTPMLETPDKIKSQTMELISLDLNINCEPKGGENVVLKPKSEGIKLKTTTTQKTALENHPDFEILGREYRFIPPNSFDFDWDNLPIGKLERIEGSTFWVNFDGRLIACAENQIEFEIVRSHNLFN